MADIPYNNRIIYVGECIDNKLKTLQIGKKVLRIL